MFQYAYNLLSLLSSLKDGQVFAMFKNIFRERRLLIDFTHGNLPIAGLLEVCGKF